ncbi:helicase-related protein [Mycolicibacterium arseniciresistens]|uniref:Helicase-related protein n=1 Tax=Mycolicibacterium arseniciresistens TaxID=3062257 RepID=A0ABT8U9J5_9MYCO|nr:helicase-related protein [Mycolicibacterium arseniciresistens]MDO3634457.1 helicase-related protein [Mycolicibacterium arseniciresistens]
MTDLKGKYAFRDALSQAMIDDLVGPAGGPDEVIADPPITRYVAGVLYPAGGGWRSAGTADAAQDVDENDGYDEVVNPDPAVAMANVRNPGSMGLSFAVDAAACSTIRVHIRGARYAPLPLEKGETEPRWKRTPMVIESETIDVTTPEHGERRDLPGDLKLFIRVRSADSSGTTAVTVVLINDRKPANAFGERDGDALFQPELIVESITGGAVFVERISTPTVGHDDEEVLSNELLFSHVPNIAVGHGCSVAWRTNEKRSAERLATTFTPSYDLPLADSNPAIDIPALDMRMLASAGRDEVIAGLRELAVGYREWIASTDEEAHTLSGKRREAARRHVKRCAEAAHRIDGGIDLLEKSSDAFQAFRLTNAAMIEQRIRSERILNGRPELRPDDIAARWRPFQLSFVLLCLKGIADASDDDRNTTDLLWFPTGGGKTEAYLGLIGFTVFLRRLTGRGAGVTALMRYTLRLLTIQQFERATLLICCCESIRRDRNDLGGEEISIGLYVGRSATPLTRKAADEALKKLRQSPTAIPKEGNPVQFRSCPWCGTKLDAHKYWVGKSPARLNINCENDDCEFAKHLPAYLVDEDVYDHHPTLVIGTVDKFAGLPWRAKANALFNRDRPNQSGIDLIIQDELHLISGPLGTLTGLYETVVDHLAGREGFRPKVIASTATIRRAEAQCNALFDRPVMQFPPPGIDSRDSYFAVEADPAKKGNRRYLGVMSPGKSQTTLLVRVYAALLQYAEEIEGEAADKDPYWTLVGYFNSLRVLAGARMQVQDDVEERIDLLAVDENSRRFINDPIELTSRASSVDIPGYLKRMRTTYPDQDALSVILATNMISVGVDIDRLGLMAVMGQPQSTSEYIQSTSRVGRQHPGLVVTLYNAARSRDRSHYESFVPYHSALYREVESTSVTPFSPRARDRGLHAVLVALARHTVDALHDNRDAVNIAVKRPEVEHMRDLILDRIEKIDRTEVEPARAELDQFIDSWERRAGDDKNLVYANREHPEHALLIEAAEDTENLPDVMPTLWSLRDVDRTSNLYLART